MDPARYPNFTYTRYQARHFEAFKAYRMDVPKIYCANCLVILYNDEIIWEKFPADVVLFCNTWGYEAISHPQHSDLFAVCGICVSRLDSGIRHINWPGPNINHILQELEFNYRERAALSPMKIMTRISRGMARTHNYCGHYVQSGSTWTEYNIEFTQMLYGGLNGSILNRLVEPLDLDKVKLVFQYLQQINPLLAHYNTPQLRQQMTTAALQKIQLLGEQERPVQEWQISYVFPLAEQDPMAGNHNLEDQILALDTTNDNLVDFKSDAATLVAIFPYLFTHGLGYYSLYTPQGPARIWEHYGGPANGGYGDANSKFSLKGYVKQLILMADRRFGQSPEFLFFMLDLIEKRNIHPSNCHVLFAKSGTTYTASSVYDGENYIKDKTSLVPHIVRGSEAAKRRHHLNLFVSV